MHVLKDNATRQKMASTTTKTKERTSQTAVKSEWNASINVLSPRTITIMKSKVLFLQAGYYVPCPFKRRAIMSLHSFLSFIALGNVCHFTISSTMLYNRARACQVGFQLLFYALRAKPLSFKCSRSSFVIVSLKCELSFSGFIYNCSLCFHFH